VAAQLGCAPLVDGGATAKAIGERIATTSHRVIHLACHARARCLALTPAVSEASKTMYKAAADAQETALEVEREKGAEAEETAEARKEAEAIREAAASAIAEVEAAQALGPLGDGLLLMDMLTDRPLRGMPTVMLSGSHAADGQTSHDSTLGLPRTLLLAGARSVVSSSLELADEPARVFAAAFYAALLEAPSRTQAEALQKAMLATRTADDGKWAHPAYWSGFTVVGAAKGL